MNGIIVIFLLLRGLIYALLGYLAAKAFNKSYSMIGYFLFGMAGVFIATIVILLIPPLGFFDGWPVGILCTSLVIYLTDKYQPQH